MNGTSPSINDAAINPPPVNAANSVNAAGATAANNQNPLNGWLDYITKLYEQFINPYTSAVQKYAAFIAAMGALETDISKLIKASGDTEKPVDVDCAAILEKIRILANAFEPPNAAAALFTATADGADGKAQAEQWAAELGMHPSCVDFSNGKWIVKIDLNPLYSIQVAFNRPGGKFDPNTYEALRSAKDANVQLFQNKIKTLSTQFAQRLSEANNVTTLWSSTCKSAFDMYASYLR